MDQLGRALARWHLEGDGYIVSFDVSCASGEADGARSFRFDVVGLRVAGGAIERAVLAAMRPWWHPQAYLTPSIIRSHLLPGLSDALSEEAVDAFRQSLGLGPVPVERVLFFSHASPEKQSEAEDMLRRVGVETVYLERIAARLAETAAGRSDHTDARLTQIRSLLRGTIRAAEGRVPEPDPEAPEPVPTPPSPQLPLDFFGENAWEAKDGEKPS
ncbi:MAG: hypothetical protein M5R36_11340 [Deltaproteobacteria bacterium]|nr:hypothetical protein [Deltaproteobacteria bacterium]